MKNKIRFEKQLDLSDCGLACLKMISSYYGKYYPIEHLRKLVDSGKDGISLLSISKAAEVLGFKTTGGIITFEDIIVKSDLPCILHWNQNHFVVLHQIKKGKKLKFYIADPGKGFVEYNKEEFLNHWVSTTDKDEKAGVVLLFEPTSKFHEAVPPIVRKKKKLAFLVNYFSKYKKFFFQLIIGLFIGSLLQLIFPFLMQSIVDVGIGDKDISFIWLVLIAQLTLIFSKASIDFIRTRLLLHISTRINISLISDFFIKLMKLPMAFFDSRLLGDILQRIEDHKRIEQFLTTQSLSLIFSVFSFIIFSIVLFIYNITIFLVFLIGSLIYGFWISLFLKKRKTLDYKYFEQQGVNRSKTYQLINGMQEIKLQGSEQQKRWDWEDTQTDLFDTRMEVLSLQQTQSAGSIIINEVKNLIITVISAASVIHGEITLGMMLSIQYIIGQLNSPIEQIMSFIYQWQDVDISLERMNEIHEKEDEENVDRSTKSLCKDDSYNIEMKNVSFKYEIHSQRRILNNINLLIPEKKITAIVGESGSGKTTLIKLLLGYYTPTEGAITVGRTPLNKLNLSWWRSQCGTVMQDGYIFSESIVQNITSSSGPPDIERLRYSTASANIDGFIENLALSYNTVIGQEGQGISQGQKQRLLIARAFYKDPQFLFLDEATNALDARNEKVIMENLNNFFVDKTVVIVAHRLSTVKNADQIIVLEDGKIVEQGNHESLTLKRGKYYQLVKNQLELGT